MPTRPDACPGVFALHDAADGALARVRLPGGAVDAAALRVLAGCAEDLGDGALHLTSRGNVQLRGLRRDDHRLAERLAAAGLLPSPAHERARNVLASPLSGITGGLADVRDLVPALDRALCARPELAALPGRFLFALDDGRGDVAAEHPDLCWQATAPEEGTLRIAGTVVARVPMGDVVPSLLDAAATLRGLRSQVVPPASRNPDASSNTNLRPGFVTWRWRAYSSTLGGGDVPTGSRVGRVKGALVCAPVLGEMAAAQVRVLADCAARVVVTPWRTIVVPGADAAGETRLVAAGFVTDPASPVPLVSACAGRPGCAKALADVRGDARAGLAAGLFSGRVHLSGCERRCGSPHSQHRALVAGADGRYVG